MLWCCVQSHRVHLVGLPLCQFHVSLLFPSLFYRHFKILFTTFIYLFIHWSIIHRIINLKLFNLFSKIFYITNLSKLNNIHSHNRSNNWVRIFKYYNFKLTNSIFWKQHPYLYVVIVRLVYISLFPNFICGILLGILLFVNRRILKCIINFFMYIKLRNNYFNC